ncbi:Hsp20/alpha crystallin family protein [Spirosoma fluminis]
MYQKQAFQSEHTGNCGSRGRGKFGGPWGRGKFGNFWGGPGFGRHAGGFSQPPVNIEETDGEYVISLFAAGLVKENVTLTVKNDVLAIAYPGINQEADSASTTAYTYQEYTQRAFERSFQLNNKVLVDSISASYADGILKVVLPKNPATNQPAQTITVG